MPSLEQRVARLPLPQLWYGGGVLLLLASAVARLAAYPIVTSDYTYFVAKWFDALQAPWLSAFHQPFADYAPLYLYFIKLLTFLPASSLYSEKTLSLMFDAILAAFAAGTLTVLSERWRLPERRFFAFALFLSIPTFAINSSLWGQSDAVYAAGVVACLYYMLAERPLAASVALGLALSIKVQTVFFVPIFVGWCARDLPKRWWCLLLPPGIFLLSVLPAVLSGGSPEYWFLIYAKQAGEYAFLNVSAQSIFAYVNDLPMTAFTQNVLFWLGIAAAAVAAVVGMWLSYLRDAASKQRLVFASLLCATLIPFLLPRMHERYFYLADAFAVLYALLLPRRFLLPVAVVSASFLAYMPFLSKQVAWFSAFHVDLRLPATVMLLVSFYLIFIELPVYWSRWRELLLRTMRGLEKQYGGASANNYRS